MSSIPFISHRMFVAAVNLATPPSSSATKDERSPARSGSRRREPVSKTSTHLPAQPARSVELEVMAANGG